MTSKLVNSLSWADYPDFSGLQERIESGSNAGPSKSQPSTKRKFPGKQRVVDPDDFEDYADAVDELWSVLPLDILRRPGEAAWDVDPLGPVGAERFDNVYGKVSSFAYHILMMLKRQSKLLF